MTLSIIVAFTSRGFGIGNKGTIPWDISEDRAHFRRLTVGSTVVMGRGTWESLPASRRPLRDRLNVVVSSTVPETSSLDVVFVGPDVDVLAIPGLRGDIFIIGGAALYSKYVGVADKIFVTAIDKDVECDTVFPIHSFGHYDIGTFSPSMFSSVEECTFRFITYLKRPTAERHVETPYLDLMTEILATGNPRVDRTRVGTLALFARSMSFDISKFVPFLTTKRLAWRSVIKELLWFTSGGSDSKELERQGVCIWKANTSREFLDRRGLSHYAEGDCGPMYSHALRHFGAEYTGCHADYKDKGGDQLKAVLQSLREDPFSRRHIMTTFNPSQEKKCALTVCHGIAIQFYVEQTEDTTRHLSCSVYSRSQDVFLGTPFNVASYSVLVYIVAAMTGMSPRALTMFSGDTHLYSNHLDQVREQLTRPPLPPPVLMLSARMSDRGTELEDISIDDFSLVGYIHHPAIHAAMAV